MNDYVMEDILTGAELTPQNAIRCFDGYLNEIKEVSGDTVISLMLYFDYALSIKDSDLLSFMVWRVIETMEDYQYKFGRPLRIP